MSTERPGTDRGTLVLAGLAGVLVAIGIVVRFVGPSGDAASPPATTTPADEAPCLELPGAAPTPNLPSFTLTKGNFLTMSDTTPRAAEVVVDRGRILSVGSKAAQSGSGVDLEGATIIPGLIDSHAHWIGDRSILGDSISEAIDDALAQGWTTIGELFVDERRLEELCSLARDDRLPLKVAAFLPANYGGERFDRWYDRYQAGQVLAPHLFLAGIKFFADRAEDGLGYQTDPPDPAVQGLAFWEPDELATEFQHAHDTGWQIAIHATGDGGLDIVLDAFRELGSEAIVAGRHRVEHLTIVRDDQVDGLAELGLTASVQFSWFNSDSVETLTRWLGEDRVELTGRWRDLLDARIPLVGSTDHPHAISGESGDSMDALAFAVTRIGPSGEQPPGWMRAQRLTVMQALRAMTIDAAFAQRTETSVGSITPGKLADLVVLTADPTRVEPKDLSKIEVLATIVDGVVQYCHASVPRELRPRCPAG